MQTVERSSKCNSSIFWKVLDNVLGTENGVIRELRVVFLFGLRTHLEIGNNRWK